MTMPSAIRAYRLPRLSTLMTNWNASLNALSSGLAAADKFTMTRMLGVPANLVIGAAFAISGLLAGVVALFWLGRIGSVTPGIGLAPLLIAFIATVIGGMRSLAGAVVGGYVLAFITVAFNLLLPQELLDFRQAFIFTLVILILLFRPEGLIRGA